ncbi:Solute carrier family 28 member 3, partial [Toxocara canis]
EESSLLESISAGAVQAVSVIFAIISNLIVFLALVTFFDTSIGFFARLIGYEGVTFNMLLGYMFFPLAYVMGVSDASESQRRTEETLRVAQLIGTKTLLNEFIAYQQMSEMLRRGELGSRAQMMAVFACCGYSNASQIGSQLGIFGSMAPSKRRSFAKAAVRSLIAGSIACFMTAVVAGTIVSGDEHCAPSNATTSCVRLEKIV